MRIALVCPYSFDRPGGVATHVRGLATWLATQGHVVDVVAPGTSARRGAPVVGVTEHLLGRAVGFGFNGSTAQLAVSQPQADAARRIARDADVVHVHEPLTPGIAFAVAKQAPRLVVTHHAAFAVGTPLRAALRRRARRLGERVGIAVSQAAADTALRATGARPTVVPNGMVLPPAPPARSGWRGGEAPRIGFLGRRDEPRKGFPVFGRVAEAARAAGVPARFEAAGPGRATHPSVRTLGALDDDAKAAWLRTVDVLVAPNLGGESFGIVLVEALAAGADVVASDLPAFTDVLTEAGAGRGFAVGDVEACLRSVREALAAPVDPLRAHRAAARWSWDCVGPAVLAAYGRVVGG